MSDDDVLRGPDAMIEVARALDQVAEENGDRLDDDELETLNDAARGLRWAASYVKSIKAITDSGPDLWREFGSEGPPPKT